VVTLAAWITLLAVNDALPYLGLRDDSCQTMFSSLEWTARSNNHLFVPQYALSDQWLYLDVRDVEIQPLPTERFARYAAEWLTAPARLRNAEAIRVAAFRLCTAGHQVSFSVRAEHDPGPPRSIADACADPTYSRPRAWIPVRLYETDEPAETAR
jgi:hypothetical protein